MSSIQVVLGDITKQKTDVIVNAANTSLLGGGGVDGAIHRAAGPELLQACRKLGGCATGDAKITPAFRLPHRYIIHAVGPVWSGGKRREDELLANCYRNSLQLANEYSLKTVAFPAIGTGAYRFPVERAAKIAAETVYSCLQQLPSIEIVYFVCFSEKDKALYEEAVRPYHMNHEKTGS